MNPLKEMKVTSPFGPREAPIKGASTFHSGVDLKAPMRTECYAESSGIVKISTEYKQGIGKYIIIEHDAHCTTYGHLDELLVKQGQTVSEGQLIAYTGNTGNSQAPHLHFEVRKCQYDKNYWTKPNHTYYKDAVDPIKFLEERKNVISYTAIKGKTIIPIHSLNKATCASYSNTISGTFQYKNVTSSMFCTWGKWKRKSSTHDWLKQPETVIYINKKGEVKSQRCLYASEIKDDVVHAVGGLGLHDYNPNLEGFKGAYADVLRNTYHTAIGYDGEQWIGVYAKGTAKQIRLIMIDTFGCKYAILLDGGHIAAINVGLARENLIQPQNNMIQFI